MSDVVERLLAGVKHETFRDGYSFTPNNPDGKEAAAEITRLRAQVASLTAAVEGGNLERTVALVASEDGWAADWDDAMRIGRLVATAVTRLNP